MVAFRILASSCFESPEARRVTMDTFELLKSVTNAPTQATGKRGSNRSPAFQAVISCLIDTYATQDCKAESLKFLNVMLASTVRVSE